MADIPVPSLPDGASGPNSRIMVVQADDSLELVPGDIAVTGDYVPTSGGTFTGAVSVPAPTADTHASTKLYVDQNAGGATDLDGLSDVTITTPTNGQALTYNGAAWVNQAAAGGGDLLAANNLSDVADAPTSLSNLGGATAAQGALADTALQQAAGGESVTDLGAVEENVNTVALSGATLALDVSTHGVHDVTMDQNCTLSFTNPAPAGKASSFMLVLRGAFTPTLPASVTWATGTAPTYTTPSVYVFTTVDAGTTWLGTQPGAAFS